MRQMIAGRVYDTDTATKVGDTVWNPEHFNTLDPQYWEESLYRTKRGGWFFYCAGGGQSPYSINKEWGETLLPASVEAAELWLKKYGQEEALKQYFGSPIEEPGGYAFKLRDIPARLHTAVKAAATESGRSMNSLILEAVHARYGD